MFFAERGKTGKPVGGALSDRALLALQGYLQRLGVELAGEAYVFRNRSGAAYSKDTLGDDFRDVRGAAFGDGERRTLAEFRRSGAVEAIVGGAKAEELAHAMGNTLSASNALFETYVPVNVATIRHVMEASPSRPGEAQDRLGRRTAFAAGAIASLDPRQAFQLRANPRPFVQPGNWIKP